MSDAMLRRLLWVVLAVALVLLYLPVLDAPFVYDDKIEVVGNDTLRDLAQWRAVATYNVSRPLLVLSYAVDFHRSGLDPRGYHVTNLVVAALCLGSALLLVEAVLRLGRIQQPLMRAGVVVGLWALHPMGTEAITYITGRSESLCALFCFLSLWAWAQALLAQRQQRSGLWWRLAGVAAFVGAVMTKEVGAAVPLAALALELFFAERRQGKMSALCGALSGVRWAWMLPSGLLLGAAAWLRLQHAATFLPREVDRGLAVQVTTQAEAWLRYVALWLLPWGQTIFHHLSDVAPLSLQGGLAWAGWALMVGLAVRWGRALPTAGFALLAGAIFLLPSSSIVPLKESMAEHRAFQTGLWLLLAIAASIPPRWARRTAIMAVPVGLLLGGLTHLRHGVWASETGLWQEATQRQPDVAAAWYGLGDAWRFAGQFDQAAAAYQQVIDRDPDHLDAWNNLGITRASLGDLDGAQAAWTTALRKSPTYCKAHNNLGVLAEGKRDWDKALVEYSTTLSYCSDDARAELGMCSLHYGPRRDRERAVYHCERFLSLAPTSGQALQVKDWLLELTF